LFKQVEKGFSNKGFYRVFVVLALAEGISGSIFYLRGFAPADEALLFRQKCPKPFSPVRGPVGPSASVPNHYGSETRSAQTVLAEG